MRSDQKSLYERAEKEIGNETFLKDFYTDFTSGNSFKFSVVLKKECIYGLHFVSKNSSDKIHVLLEKGNKDGLTVESEMDFSFKGKTTISPKETKAYTIAIQNSSIGKTEVMAVLTLKHMKEVTGNKSDEFTRQDTLKVKKEKTNNSSTNDEVFMIVEEMPSFGDGSNEAFGRFVAENLNYPDEAVKKGIHGKVFVQFIVEVDGSISNVKVLRSVNPMLDIEAVRVVQSSPKWNPGRQKGKTVRVTYTMPINFTLEKVKVENKSEKIENEVFLVVEEMPEFIGGQEALGKFITENLVYPQQAAEDSIQGKVFIEFVINEEGELKDHKVLRGVHPILDEEALRVMKLSPKWKPGKQRGKTVSVKFTLPITFALH